MKQFLLTTPRSCDQKCVFRLVVTPRQRDVAVWPHAVAPNSESCFCILCFCNVSLSCTRGASGKVQSCGSQQHAPHFAPVRPIYFSGLLGSVNLAAVRSEAGAPITVQKESQTEGECTKDQRSRAAIVQQCKSPGTGMRMPHQTSKLQ